MQYLLIALGGALGSVCRFALSSFITQRANSFFPWATLSVNITGSLLIGFALALFSHRTLSDELFKSFVIIGFLGGFTTFSTFSAETMGLIEADLIVKAVLNIIASFSLCVGAAFTGISLGRWFLQ